MFMLKSGLALAFCITHVVALSLNAETPHRLLLSSNFIDPPTFWRHMGTELKNPIKLLFVPTAALYLKRDSTSTRSSGDRRRRARAASKQSMRSLGVALASVPGRPEVETQFLDVSDPAVDAAAVASALRGCDCVYVTGGNTYFLMHHLRRTSFPGAFRAAAGQRSLLYLGLSAGAICAGESLKPVLWKGWDEPIPELDTADGAGSMVGMGLAEGVSFFPHYARRFEGVAAVGRASLGHRCVLLAEQGVQEGEGADPAGPSSAAAAADYQMEYWSSVTT
jgi:hypothetical protein